MSRTSASKEQIRTIRAMSIRGASAPRGSRGRVGSNVSGMKGDLGTTQLDGAVAPWNSSVNIAAEG